MVSSLTKGILNFLPCYMPKHVSGDTDFDTKLRLKKKLIGCLYTVLLPFLLLEKHTFRFGRGSGFMTGSGQYNNRTIVT
jgi:hypothetical protein